MSGHGEKLSRNQERAITALLSHSTIGLAAQACGISEATLWRWLQLPDFQQRYRAAQQTVFANAVAELQKGTTEAAEALRAVLKDPLAKPGEKVSAARVILEFSLRTRESLELEERLRALEAAQQKTNIWSKKKA